MSNQLLPCPFCGDVQLSKVDMVYNHPTGRTKGFRIKCGTCGAQAPDTCWNHRATQPPAGEPVAWIIESPEGCSPCKSINHLKHMAERYAAAGWSVTPLYAAPPADTHGAEAVRKDAERYRWLRKMDRPHGDMTAPGEIGWPYVCVAPGEAVSLCLERMDSAIDAAMRAQAGEGGEV